MKTITLTMLDEEVKTLYQAILAAQQNAHDSDDEEDWKSEVFFKEIRNQIKLAAGEIAQGWW